MSAAESEFPKKLPLQNFTTPESLHTYESEEEDGLAGIVKGMNHDPILGTTNTLPTPQQQPLTPEQLKILTQLPEEPGHYWVENIQTNERNVAYIDKTRTTNTVEHWGHSMNATFGAIAVIERWLMNWTILGKIEPYKEPVEYESNTNFGMF